MITTYLYQTIVVSQQVVAYDFPIFPTTPAYLDPGTGSLLIQMLIGFLIGGLVAPRVFWKRTIWFFKGMFGGGSERDETKN